MDHLSWTFQGDGGIMNLNLENPACKLALRASAYSMTSLPRPRDTISVKAICLLLDPPGERLFVIRCADPGDRSIFYKPPGGTVEFREHARDAVAREVREELGASLQELRHLDVLEFMGSYDGRPFHEITFVFVASFVDPAFYRRLQMQIWDDALDGPGLEELTALWVPLQAFFCGKKQLGPPGLLPLLERLGKERSPSR